MIAPVFAAPIFAAPVSTAPVSTAPPLPHSDPCGANPCRPCAARLFSVCGAIPESGLEELAATVAARPFARRDLLVGEGEDAGSFFSLTEGAVKLVRRMPDGRQQILGFAFAGDFVGLAQRGHYGYGVEALSAGAACRFPRAGLERLTEHFPPLRERMAELAGQELLAAQDQMLALGRKTARERLAGFLLQMARRQPAGETLVLAMTRGDIADYLGLTIETVSRTFSALKRDRLIALAGAERVHLLDRARLERIGEGWT